MRRYWRIKRSGDRIKVNLEEQEIELLQSLLEQLGSLVGDDPAAGDDRLRRLFPTAYPDDPERDAEYHKYMREELVASHRAAIDRFASSLRASELTDAEAMSWTQSLNSIRLVLGTMLDVSEDSEMSEIAVDDPEYGSYVLYGYLSELLDEVVQALS
jgi:Domain of unknown function (DUF2017)